MAGRVRESREGGWAGRAVRLAASALLACSPGPPPDGPPSIALVVIDTLRADHLGCYGYPRPTSPEIDAFAARAIRYTRAIASAPWTVPSHASMFTGLAPFEHGAHSFRVERRRNNERPLDDRHLTLAEALASQGYRTAAFVANAAYLARHWQLDQGFETYRVERIYADRLNRWIFDWLEETPRDAPFFLFVNYIDVHAPFNARPRADFDLGARPDGGRLHRELIRRVLPARDPVPSDLVARVVDQYDTAIRNVDEQVGAVVERLERLHPGSLVVVTSDHGHYFGEHRLVGHAMDVYQETLRVPLILRAPGQLEGRVDESLVLSHDLPGLILSQLPEPLRSALGSRFPRPPTARPALAENYYSRPYELFHPEWGSRFQRVRRALFDWPYKLIHSSDGRNELYDLEADPGESQDLYASRPEVAARLERALGELGRGSQEPPSGGPPELGSELERELEALGYAEPRE